MTTLATPAPASPAAAPAVRFDHASLSLTAPRVLRSELLKLWTLRSTRLGVATLVVVVAGVGLVGAATAPAEGLTAQHTIDLTLIGAAFGVLLAAALGALAGAREFASGMIRTTLAAVPRRGELVVAKAVALVAVLLPAALVAVVVAFLGGAAVLDARGLAAPSFATPDAVRVVLGTAVYMAGIAVIGLAVGLLVRSTAGAVATVLGAVLILPALAGALLPARFSNVLELLPSAAGDAFTATGHPAHLLAPLAGAADFAGWIVVAVALSALALRRRDA